MNNITFVYCSIINVYKTNKAKMSMWAKQRSHDDTVACRSTFSSNNLFDCPSFVLLWMNHYVALVLNDLQLSVK